MLTAPASGCPPQCSGLADDEPQRCGRSSTEVATVIYLLDAEVRELWIDATARPLTAVTCPELLRAGWCGCFWTAALRAVRRPPPDCRGCCRRGPTRRRRPVGSRGSWRATRCC